MHECNLFIFFTSSFPFYKIKSNNNNKWKVYKWWKEQIISWTMCCQEAFLIKKKQNKTLLIRSSCTAEDNCGRKSKKPALPSNSVSSPTHKHTHTQTLSFRIPLSFFYHLSYLSLVSLMLSSSSCIHFASTAHQEDEPLNSHVQPSRRVRDWFSGFCPHQHSVAMVASCQRFLLNLHEQLLYAMHEDDY